MRSPRVTRLKRPVEPPLIISTVPVWYQVAALLRNRIYNGAYGAGQALPGELQLSREFGMSRVTIRRALAYLATEGLILRRQGRPSIVSHSIEQRPQAATGFVEDLITLFQATRLSSYSLENADPEHLPAWVTQFLETSHVLHIRRIRSLNDLPFAVADSYLPAKLGRKLNPSDLRHYQLLELLDWRLRTPVHEAEQCMQATGASPDVANALAITAGAPVLRLDLFYRADAGRPLACSRVYIRGDRYVYRVRLFRRTQIAPEA